MPARGSGRCPASGKAQSNKKIHPDSPGPRKSGAIPHRLGYTLNSISCFDSRQNVPQAVFELREEPASPSFKSFANIRIVEILRITIKEATLRRALKFQMRKHRCQHYCILT